MMKRNDGYVLIYVMVVLAILEVIALSVMSMALVPQKNQVATLERMQEKYAAQGYVTKTVAYLEHDLRDLNKIDFSTYSDVAEVEYTAATDTTPDLIKITATEGSTTVTAELEIVAIKSSSAPENKPVVSVISGYTLTYRSYKTVTADDTEVTAS